MCDFTCYVDQNTKFCTKRNIVLKCVWSPHVKSRFNQIQDTENMCSKVCSVYTILVWEGVAFGKVWTGGWGRGVLLHACECQEHRSSRPGVWMLGMWGSGGQSMTMSHPPGSHLGAPYCVCNYAWPVLENAGSYNGDESWSEWALHAFHVCSPYKRCLVRLDDTKHRRLCQAA